MAEIVRHLTTAVLAAQRKPDIGGGRRVRERRRYRPVPAAMRGRVSAKIRKLVREGKPQNVAVAMALSMARQGRLGPRGGYIRAGR